LNVNASPLTREASDAPPQMLERPKDAGYGRIAYHRLSAANDREPGLVWLGGFRSAMNGAKAQALAAFAADRGCACLRFDYSGHGASEGRFEDGTISTWLADAYLAVTQLTRGPQILVASSMGAWIALRLAQRLRAAGEGDRIAGFVLLAPAVDFTEDLIWQAMSRQARRHLAEDGVWYRPSAYADTPDPITQGLIADGRTHLMLGDTVHAGAPVHILHGLRDRDVPWAHAVRLVERLAGDPVVVTLVKDGDHRLSRAEDLARMASAVETLLTSKRP
jgi:pimeloyl-ACP methyl ester carboxylesterase